MANDRLAAALNNGVGGSEIKQIAYRRAMLQRGLYCDCGFCGREWSSVVISGPIVGICEECATLITGMYLVAARDSLSIADHFQTILDRALTEYRRDFGQPAPIKKPRPRQQEEGQ